MFTRFTEEARRATALASQESRQLGHDFIGTEHLLLGLLASAEGAAFSVLTELEVTLDDARRKVAERVHGYGTENVESPPFTPLAKKSLEKALHEALQLGAEHIGSEHLLLGLIAVPDGGGARILAELAGSASQVRETVLARVGPLHKTGGTLEQTRASGQGRTLRRWAAHSRTVFRPPGTSAVGSTASGSAAADIPGPPPRCPACQSPLAMVARYRQVPVPAGTDEAEEPYPEDLEGRAPEPAASQSGATDSITVSFVYCGHCGVSLGIA